MEIDLTRHQVPPGRTSSPHDHQEPPGGIHVNQVHLDSGPVAATADEVCLLPHAREVKA